MSHETIQPTQEFGPRVAEPLKEAIAQTGGISVVRTSPARGAITALKFGIEGYSKRGSALAPGEVLFVGFDNPTYNLGEMNKVISEVARKVVAGRITVSSLAIAYDNVIGIGSVMYEEEAPERIIRNTTTTYSAKDPFLKDLLRGAKIEPEHEYTSEQSFHIERSTHAVFYPSRAFAELADDFGQFVETDRSAPRWQVNIPRGYFGAMTTLKGEDFRKIAAARSTERKSIEEVFSKFHPNFRASRKV